MKDQIENIKSTKLNEDSLVQIIRKELYKNLNNKVKNWKKIFNEFKTLDDLKEFYERQKITFTTKKQSTAGSIYFFEFINAFLRFKSQLDDRSKVIIAVLFKNLKEIDKNLYLKLEELLDEDLKQYTKRKFLKDNDWEETFCSFNNIDELFNFYLNQSPLFPKKKKSLETVNNYYIPFI